jgi:hypothetical protein
MIDTSIKRAFAKGRQRNWDKIYVAVDIHDTIVHGGYSKNIDKNFYPKAKEVVIPQKQ